MIIIRLPNNGGIIEIDDEGNFRGTGRDAPDLARIAARTLANLEAPTTEPSPHRWLGNLVADSWGGVVIADDTTGGPERTPGGDLIIY